LYEEEYEKVVKELSARYPDARIEGSASYNIRRHLYVVAIVGMLYLANAALALDFGLLPILLVGVLLSSLLPGKLTGVGVFDVKGNTTRDDISLSFLTLCCVVDGRVIFSKHSSGRFPFPGELVSLLAPPQQ
jgi:hypothetical protein